MCRDPGDPPELSATHWLPFRWTSVTACFLCFLFASPALPQSQFDTWTTDNGLPQNSINDIVQTRDGYLWVATFGGLVRFDGARFVVFDRSTDGIQSQRIRQLHEDRAGTLWASTEEGMLIRYRDGRFTTFGSEHGLPAVNTYRIEESDDGKLWIRSKDVVTSFDGERAVTHDAADFGLARTSTFIWDVWWSQDRAGLHVLIAGQVETYPVSADAFGAEVTGVNRDPAGNLWVRTKGAGVVRIAGTQTERYTTREGMPSDAPNGVFRMDRHGNIWFTDVESRIYRIRNGTWELVTETGLLTLFEDREGSTWLGTNIGLHRVRDFSARVYTHRDGLSVDWVYSILQARDGAIWIGTWGGGLNRLEGGRISRFTAADGLRSDWITSLFEDRSGRLWVGTTAGINHLENGRFRSYRDGSGLLDRSVWAIHEDRAGAFWFATEAGLVRLADGRFTRYTSRDNLTDDRITALFEDRAGVLWIGAFQGLTRFTDGQFIRYGDHEGLVRVNVRAIHEDRDGVLWIGTYDSGLYRLAGERLTRFTRKEGLHDNGVFQILEDDEGYLWTGSNRGISRLSRRDLNDVAQGRSRSIIPVVFGTKDGLLNVEVNGGRQPSGWKTPDGRLWFPTMGGVAVFDPSAFHIDTHAPATLVEELQVDGQPVDVAMSLTVPAGASAFAIRYTAPSFVRPEQIRFRYRLAGLDDEWVDAGDARTATYRRIPPGEYVFTVTAANHHGVWSTSGQSVRIVVLPPFWRTWWFAGLSVAALVAVVFTGHEMRVRQLRREHARQTTYLRQLIETQEEERRRISSEMHDSLGQHLAIIKRRAGTRSEPLADHDAIAKELEEIAGVADRIGAEVKEIAHGLRPYQLDTIGLSKTLDRLVRRVSSACRIDCVADIGAVDDALPAEAGIHVYRIVQESLNNIIKHSKATRAQVKVTRDHRSLEVSIEDNGVGFRPDAVGNASSATQGFGLMGLRERVQILGGEIEIRSSPGHGTLVRVRVKLERHA